VCPTASERAAALAEDFAAANAEAVAFTRACPPEAWGCTVPGEGWTVGVTLHHIAETYQQSRRWVAAMSSGDGVDDTAEAIDKANAAHAARAVAATPAETATLLLESGALLEAALRACSDDELDTKAPFGPAGGAVYPTVELAAVPARHTREHLSHARAAAGGG
jgi:hypothetical protein